MFSDVIVSTSSYLDPGMTWFGADCYESGVRDPVVVLRVGDVLSLHFGDPAVLAGLAVAVADAQDQLDAALLRRVQSPLPVDREVS